MARRTTRLALVGGAVALIATGALIAADALGARASLEAAQRHVAAVQSRLAKGDAAGAEDSLADARRAVDAALGATDGLRWDVGSRVPLAGRSLRIIQEVVAVADASVAVAADAVEPAAELLGGAGRLELRRPDGGIDLDRVGELGARLDAVDTAGLAAARDRLAGVPGGFVPQLLRANRAEVLGLADRSLGTADNARAAVGFVQRFLGQDGPRRYFLAMQNPSEVRGTGGLIGFFSILTVEDGRFTVTAPEVYSPLAVSERGVFAPVPTSDEFRALYAQFDADGFLANVNMDPDMPTVAPVILDIYEDRRGERLDGVVALDPVGLSLLMQAIGPVDLPDELVVPGVPDPVLPARIPELTMVEAYDLFGGPSTDRKEFLGVFAQEVFSSIFTRDWDAVALGRNAGQAAGRRTLQLWSRDAEEQATIERLGLAGAMRPLTEGGDLLAVTANNAAGNKQDVHVAHRITGRIDLAADGSGFVRRTGTLEAAVENPLPTSGRDIYIIGAHPLGAASRATWGAEMGLNRTMLSVWAPAGTTFPALRVDGEVVPGRVGRIHGNATVSHFLETPSESTRSMEVDLQGVARVTPDGPDRIYDLTLWRQGKAVPDHWDLTIAAPEGWAVSAVGVTGGGNGQGMGVGGDGRPVTGTVVGGEARIRGAATQDVHVRVRLSRPLLGRIADAFTGGGL